MGNRQQRKLEAAAFNLKREHDIAERARKHAEHLARLQTPEGRAEDRAERERVRAIYAFAGAVSVGLW